MLALEKTGILQQGDTSFTAIMPSGLLPAHVTLASATTNVSNLWRYQKFYQMKLGIQSDFKIIK